MQRHFSNLQKFQGVGGGEKHPLEWKFQRGGVSETKTFSVRGGGGVWIFFGATKFKRC